MADFDFVEYASDRGLPIADERHKHARTGWLNVECPFCYGNEGYHLGFLVERHYFVCWRCGWHPAWEVVKAIDNCTKAKALAIIAEYPARPVNRILSDFVAVKRECRYPYGFGPMTEIHRRYLRSRNFDPDEIEREWGLKGTGNLAPRGYTFRAIAPIHFEGEMVSYQGRDVTGKQSPPYRACPATEEARPHKNCLYGYDRVQGDTVIVVEGITDVWRLGPGTVATFGIEYSEAQVRLLADFKKRFVLYDSEEPQALVQARKLSTALGSLSPDGETHLVYLDVEDPALLSPEEALELREKLK